MIEALGAGLVTGLLVLLATVGAVCLIIAVVDRSPGIGVAGVAVLTAVLAALYWLIENT